MTSHALRYLAWALLLAAWPLAPPSPAAAAEPAAAAPPPIRDNSFLLEEAYNQEDGVVQHISTFSRLRDSREWVYTFTEEWPAPALKHQVSLTFPIERPPGERGVAPGAGDVALNYRYQWRGGGPERLALAPRISLLLPTGEERESRGTGGTGLQINLPLSIEVTRRLVSHTNLGATHVRGAGNDAGDEADISTVSAGQGVVWLVDPAWTGGEEVTGPGRTERFSDFFVSPGARGAISFDSGLQIVPGLAFPIGLGSSAGENGVFLYLSFEHPLRRR